MKVPLIFWYNLQKFTGKIYRIATVNKEIHIDILRRHRETVSRKRPEKWRTNSCFLVHDNAAAHRSVLFKDFLAKNNVKTLEHPPYSSDLAPAHFYLFLQQKSPLKLGPFVMLLTSLRMLTKSWKGFNKMAARNVSNTFTVAGRSV